VGRAIGYILIGIIMIGAAAFAANAYFNGVR
jgi:hypothetical protein